MWVKTCEGSLLNLNHCTQIVFEHGGLWALLNVPPNLAMQVPLFMGSAAECGDWLRVLHLMVAAQGHGVMPPVRDAGKGVDRGN